MSPTGGCLLETPDATEYDQRVAVAVARALTVLPVLLRYAESLAANDLEPVLQEARAALLEVPDYPPASLIM